jgi:hypothetical protein
MLFSFYLCSLFALMAGEERKLKNKSLTRLSIMTENYDAEELTDVAHDVRRALDRERDKMMEKFNEMETYGRLLDAIEGLLAENAKLKQENESLREEVQDERDQRNKAEMQLSEMSKLSAGVAKKASQEELLKAIRVFVNKSKRKKIEKRIAVKEMVLEMANANGVVLPEDLAATIDALDDEQPEPKVVHVAGNYNDVHDNDNVKLREKEEE